MADGEAGAQFRRRIVGGGKGVIHRFPVQSFDLQNQTEVTLRRGYPVSHQLGQGNVHPALILIDVHFDCWRRLAIGAETRRAARGPASYRFGVRPCPGYGWFRPVAQ